MQGIEFEQASDEEDSELRDVLPPWDPAEAEQEVSLVGDSGDEEEGGTEEEEEDEDEEEEEVRGDERLQHRGCRRHAAPSVPAAGCPLPAATPRSSLLMPHSTAADCATPPVWCRWRAARARPRKMMHLCWRTSAWNWWRSWQLSGTTCSCSSSRRWAWVARRQASGGAAGGSPGCFPCKLGTVWAPCLHDSVSPSPCNTPAPDAPTNPLCPAEEEAVRRIEDQVVSALPLLRADDPLQRQGSALKAAAALEGLAAALQQQEARWRQRELPGLLRDAPAIWLAAQKHVRGSPDTNAQAWQEDVAMYQARGAGLRATRPAQLLMFRCVWRHAARYQTWHLTVCTLPASLCCRTACSSSCRSC